MTMDNEKTGPNGSKPTISVAIATYEPNLSFFQEQVESIDLQTYKADEIVICDDSSSQATYDQMQDIVQKLKTPVRLVRNDTRLGFGDNFISCLSLSSGDIVFLSDQDDVWLPTKVEKILSCFAAHPEISLIIHDLIRTDENLTITVPSMLQVFRDSQETDQTYIYGAATALRKNLIGLAIQKPKLEGHDTWIHQLGILLGCRLVLSEGLGFYRRHPQAITEQRRLTATARSMRLKKHANSWNIRHEITLSSLNSQSQHSESITNALMSKAADPWDQTAVQKALTKQAICHQILDIRLSLYRANTLNAAMSAYMRSARISMHSSMQPKSTLPRLSKDFAICLLSILQKHDP
jgi:glycosyltransferase involved in cell wall biosynthesis